MKFRGEASENFISHLKWLAHFYHIKKRHNTIVHGQFCMALRKKPCVPSPYVTEYEAVNKISNGIYDMSFLSDMLRFEASR